MKQRTHTLPAQERKGLWLVFSPALILVILLLAYTMFIFLTGNVDSPALNLVEGILGSFALLSIFGGILMVPIGFRLLFRVEPTDENWDQRSGRGAQSMVPKDIKGWSWGAAGLTVYWAAYYKVWLFAALALFVPFIYMLTNKFIFSLTDWLSNLGPYLLFSLNLALIIFFGLKGNEWAWKKNKWQSSQQLKITQKKWRIWGILAFASTFLGSLFVLYKKFLELI